MEGFEVTINYKNQFKNIITRLLDEKTIIIEDFIRKNDLTPKQIVVENKADIEAAKSTIIDIIQNISTELNKDSEINKDNFKKIDEAITKCTKTLVTNLDTTINTQSTFVTDEIQALKLLLKEYAAYLQGLDKLVELNNLSYLEHLENLNILKKLESLEALDKLQDLDKLKDLSYIEHLKELEKLQILDKLENVDFNNLEKISFELEDISKILENDLKHIQDVQKVGNKEIGTFFSEILKVVSEKTREMENNITTHKQILVNNYETLDKEIYEATLQNSEHYKDLSNQLKGNIKDTEVLMFEKDKNLKDEVSKTIIDSEIRILETINESSFLEVTNKNLLPNTGYHAGKKAIVYGGWRGSKIYRFNGKSWDKI